MKYFVPILGLYFVVKDIGTILYKESLLIKIEIFHIVSTNIILFELLTL